MSRSQRTGGRGLLTAFCWLAVVAGCGLNGNDAAPADDTGSTPVAVIEARADVDPQTVTFAADSGN